MISRETDSDSLPIGQQDLERRGECSMKSQPVRWTATILMVGLTLSSLAGFRVALAQEIATPAPSPAESSDTASPQAADQPTAGEKKPLVPTKPLIIPYDQQKYIVSVSLGVAPGSGLSDSEIQRLVVQLRSLMESRIGVWWKMDVTRSLAGDPLNRAMLAARPVTSWNEVLAPTPIEKKFSLTLDREGTRFRLSGIEWDRASQSLTTIQERLTYDRRLLPAYAADLVFDLFRPLVSIDTIAESRIEMRIRGGEFLPPDVNLTPFAIGDHVTCFMRHLDKNRQLKRMQSVPWTSVRIDLVERGYLQGTLVSAFKAPLAGSRRRVELLGFKIRPAHAQTRLQVIPRGKPQSPMAGYRVEVLDRLETKDDTVADRVTLRTDRNGEVLIPADPAKPLRYLIVYSGTAPLAKAPLIPGFADRLVLQAPDDAARLYVEAETELLQSELVDLVARRAVLMARARGAAKKVNWEFVTELEQQVDALPTLEQFLVRIEALKTPAVQSAKRSKDKAQESRIVRMCQQITEMAQLHLDPVKVTEFHTEIDEQKKSQ